MDTTTALSVIGIVISLAVLGRSVYRDRHSDDKEWRKEMEHKINAKADAIAVQKEIDRFTRNDNQHFDAGRKLEGVAQSLADHKEEDTRQFGEIREMFREIRDALRDRK